MRIVLSIVLVIVITLCSSSAALPATKDSKEMTQIAASPDVVESIYTNQGRRLRRVEKSNMDDDELEEERTFGDLKSIASKLNPVTAAKKSAAKAKTVQKALQEGAAYNKLIERSKQLIKDN
ncbi:Avirulence (Avh) protein [Phytophthora megakarya]|uniref:RxLR effector protein n=1 Tax=Phytophthora megakarya TaxID=4795 RepID=A0A225UQR1_9STRA|nr:Avirulence (Avh) protein [Phytophthora megakarya]